MGLFGAVGLWAVEGARPSGRAGARIPRASVHTVKVRPPYGGHSRGAAKAQRALTVGYAEALGPDGMVYVLQRAATLR